ncbi:OzmP [Lentzea sp. BCCO 10_0798]|uniref:OzmP n=1 Tax=Lentzea kristufekii TaxID=3095430 RepID=A0ABU4TZH1_9PSEU|nr:OzmP [Lentzea sp. BCCO 10_0798]MDX8053722.1 OzmP [Lentzea sp. BCCO 10_0798]
MATELVENFRYTSEMYREFVTAGPNAASEFDCLFMYSGGKDSTFMLDRFVNGLGKRVLAYTFDIPFESKHSVQNVRGMRDKIDAEFLLDSDDDGITKVMTEIFSRSPEKPGKYLDEKLPCYSCRSFFLIRAILVAFERKIPCIALCADPQQILTMESDVRKVVQGFYRTFGAKLTDEVFKGRIEEILFAPAEELPRIVFPYIGSRYDYDPDQMVAEMKDKGLYSASPLETHCRLFGLLNLYSYTHWGSMYYKINASSHLRAAHRNPDQQRTSFSLKFPKALNVIELEERLRTTLFAISANEGDPAEHERELIELFSMLGATEDAAAHVARTCLDLKETAAEFGIPLPRR